MTSRLDRAEGHVFSRFTELFRGVDWTDKIPEINLLVLVQSLDSKQQFVILGKVHPRTPKYTLERKRVEVLRARTGHTRVDHVIWYQKPFQIRIHHFSPP